MSMILKFTPLAAVLLFLSACNYPDFGDHGNIVGASRGPWSVTLQNDGGGSVMAGTNVARAARTLTLSGYKAGDQISLEAVPNPVGTVFSTWAVVGGDLRLSDPHAATITFTMPEDNVVVKANFLGENPDVLATVQDANTKTALQQLMADDDWDTNGDGKLSISEAAAVESINLADKNLQNGNMGQLDEVIKYFTGLKNLDISGNMYVIGFDLSKNTQLEYLNANGISPNFWASAGVNTTPQIDLTWNTSLREFTMRGDNVRFLTNMLFPRTSTLESFTIVSSFLNNTAATRWNLSALTGLRQFTLNGFGGINEIVFPATATLKGVDIASTQGNNSALRYLDISMLTGLESFNAPNYTQIQTIKFPATATLRTVNISPSAAQGAMTSIDLSMLTGLGMLSMEQYRYLTDIKFPATATLQIINMKMTMQQNTALKFLDISMLPGLEKLDMSGNYPNYSVSSTEAHIKALRAVEAKLRGVITLTNNPAVLDNSTIMQYVD